MSKELSRRVLLAGVPALGVAAALPRAAAAEELSYAAFRVVRRAPGEPSRPQITLPEGYEFVPGERYDVASRAEYYTLVQGPRSDEGIEVTVRWPETPIETVIHHESRLPLRRVPGDPFAVRFTLPVTFGSPGSTQATIQVWSKMNSVAGIDWRVEHNDPDRVAGPWTTVPWPAGQVKSVLHQLVASEAILRDSGLAATAASKGHIFSLMGFETNNTLHPDNPPHWHLAYYAGPNTSAQAYLPHFWFDDAGRNYYNGMDVSGQGRSKFYVGDPAELYDFAGNLVVTITIREDGGLDIDPPDGPRYSIAEGRNGDLLDEVLVIRAGEPWLRVRTVDEVRAGVMVFTVVDLQRPAQSRTTVHRYDRLTGMLR